MTGLPTPELGSMLNEAGSHMVNAPRLAILLTLPLKIVKASGPSRAPC